ncbi:MAG: hypothetical protein WBO35_02180 [Candidatus Saccharimonadales bacterium]
MFPLERQIYPHYERSFEVLPEGNAPEGFDFSSNNKWGLEVNDTAYVAHPICAQFGGVVLFDYLPADEAGAFDEPHKLNLCAVDTREFEFGRMPFDVAFENVSPRVSRHESITALILA